MIALLCLSSFCLPLFLLYGTIIGPSTNMVCSDICPILILALYTIPIDALFFHRHREHIRQYPGPQSSKLQSGSLQTISDGPAQYSAIASSGYNASSSSSSFAFSPPSVVDGVADMTTLGLAITRTVPVFAICDAAAASPKGSCATIYDTIITSSCSTTLTAGFNRYVISDCDQNITFSTQSSYSVITATPNDAAASGLNQREVACPSPTQSVYVQNIVTYHVSPWRSLASGDPSSVTVVICKTDLAGEMSCEHVQEVWAVYTEFVQVTTATAISIDRFFQYVSSECPHLVLTKFSSLPCCILDLVRV